MKNLLQGKKNIRKYIKQEYIRCLENGELLGTFPKYFNAFIDGNSINVSVWENEYLRQLEFYNPYTNKINKIKL